MNYCEECDKRSEEIKKNLYVCDDEWKKWDKERKSRLLRLDKAKNKEEFISKLREEVKRDLQEGKKIKKINENKIIEEDIDNYVKSFNIE